MRNALKRELPARAAVPVGDAHFDLTDLGHLDFVFQSEDELEVQLAGDVTFSIVEQQEFSS